MRIAHVDVRDCVRLVDSRYDLPGTAPHAFDALANDPATVADLVDLAQVTSARDIAERGDNPDFARNLLVAGVRFADVINAAFAYPPGHGTGGGRFNDERVGAWYAACELPTAQAEVAHHRARFLVDGGILAAELSFTPYVADVNADLAVLTPRTDRALLQPDDYLASQHFADTCRGQQIAGIRYPSVRRRSGTNVVALVPHVVQNVRRQPPRTARWDRGRFTWT